MLFSFKSMGFYTEGIIHVGAKEGNIVSIYEKEDVKRILWIEKDASLYGSLYKTTSFHSPQQLYYMKELSNITERNKITFKELWRRNPGEIDIDAYDTLAIFCRDNMKEILEGFEDFLKLFRHIILHDEFINNDTNNLLINNDFSEFVMADKFSIYKNNSKV